MLKVVVENPGNYRKGITWMKKYLSKIVFVFRNPFVYMQTLFIFQPSTSVFSTSDVQMLALN